MMGAVSKLKKYSVACLLPEAAKYVTEEGFKKVTGAFLKLGGLIFKLLEIARDLISEADLEIRTKAFE